MGILPWRMTCRGGLINTMLRVPIRRLRLSRVAGRLLALGRGDITVVIGTRNQADFRLRNALRSLRTQQYPRALVKITVVDYASALPVHQEVAAVCAQFEARMIRVDNRPRWNRAHALNVGIRQADTTFTLTSDVDILFENTYISEAISALQRDPLSVIYSQTWDLPRAAIPFVAGEVPSASFAELRAQCTARPWGDGINATFTHFYHLVRGYDETYEVYGVEDVDLRRRFNWFGLTARSITNRACFIHQWHPANPGKSPGEGHDACERNQRYFESARGIIRNSQDWGNAEP